MAYLVLHRHSTTCRQSHEVCKPPQMLRLTPLRTLRRSHQQATPDARLPLQTRGRVTNYAACLGMSASVLPAFLLGWGLALPAWEWEPALPELLPGWGTNSACLGIGALTTHRWNHQLCWPLQKLKLKLTPFRNLRRSRQQATPTPDIPHRPIETVKNQFFQYHHTIPK